jgi:hypothetical protein
MKFKPRKSHMTPGAIAIIKRTELPNGTAVLTTRQPDSHRVHPFHTFAVTPTSRYAQRLTDATSASVALRQHEQMVRQLMRHAVPTGGDAA